MAPPSLPVEHKVLAVAAAYVALRVASGDKFETNVAALLTALVSFVAYTGLTLDIASCLVVAILSGSFLVFLMRVTDGLADVLVAATLVAFVTKPSAKSFDGDALSEIFAAARKATSDEPKTVFGLIVRRAQETLDDIVASLATRAADVKFFDLQVAVLARLTPPAGVAGGHPIFVLGAYRRWFNINAMSIRLSASLEDFLLQHQRPPEGAFAGKEPSRNMLVRLPPDAKPGQKATTVSPLGKTIHFVVPAGVPAGSIIQLHY